MTGNQLIVLFSVYVRGNCETTFGADLPVDQLFIAGMIEFRDEDRSVDRMQVTEKGRCFCDHVGELPLPVNEWSMPK